MIKINERKQIISEEFYDVMHGVCVKFNGRLDSNQTYGFFTRSEIGTDESGTKIVLIDFTFIPSLRLKRMKDGSLVYSNFSLSDAKTVAMERATDISSSKKKKLVFCTSVEDAFYSLLRKIMIEENEFYDYVECMLSRQRYNEMTNAKDKYLDQTVKKLLHMNAAIAEKQPYFNDFLRKLIEDVYKYYKDAPVKLCTF